MTATTNGPAVSSATANAAGFVASTLERPLPSDVAKKTSYHVLDTVAAIVSGVNLPAGRLGVEYARSLGGVDEAQVVGADFRTSAPLSAFANAMSAHADETDDSHAPSFSHPGCGVVPAALAVAEKRGRSGTELIRAVSTGYDIGTRVPPALGLEMSTHGNSLSSHAIVSLFGAVAAGAALEGLDDQQVRWALSYAAQDLSGVTAWLRDERHVQKAFVFAGMGARNGVFAATMVAKGLDGLDDIFTGHPNALGSLSSTPDPGALSDGLGDRWEIMRTNIKKYAVGSPAQAAVQGMENLINRGVADADKLAEIHVYLPADLAGIVDSRHMPNINCQYLVAGTLMDGRFTFNMAHDDDRFTDDATREMMSRVSLHEDESMRGTRQGRVTFRSTDGEEFDSYVESVRGTLQNPMSEDEVVAKAHDLLDGPLGKERATALIDSIIDYDSIPDIRDLRPLLRRAG